MSVVSHEQLFDLSFFANLAPEFMVQLKGACSEMHLEAGHVLLHRGDDGNACFGIISGQLKAFAHESTGKEMTLAVLNPGHWFGEISLVDNLPRTHGTIATQPTVILKMPKTAFDLAISQQPSIAMDVSRHLCQRLRLAFTAVEESLLLPLPQRLAKKLLFIQAPQDNQQAKSFTQVSQQEIAQMLGVSRQSVSKQLTQWAKDGILELSYNSFAILDTVRIQALAGEETVPR
ncbi:MAG: Crp/Fnr family transcriptional regulator [Bermanella sp.]